MIKKLFFFNIIIFLVIIFSLEAIARIFHLADLAGISENLIIVDKNIQTNAPNIEAIAFSKKVFTDKFGFRAPNKNFTYNESNSSVLIIGDSVSFGVGVEEQNTFVGALRNNFENLNFFNSSVSGYNLKIYPEIVKKNKNLSALTEVIFFLTLNDLSFEKTVFKENEINQNIKFFNKFKSNRYFVKLNFFLRSKSVFYMWIKGIISKPSERHFYHMYLMYQDVSISEKLSKEIMKLKKVTEKNNLKLSIIVLPYEFQTRVENCNSYFLKPQHKIRNTLISLNIKFMDYTEIFCSYEKPSVLFLKHDPVHLSPEGHMLVFNLLKKDLNYLANY